METFVRFLISSEESQQYNLGPVKLILQTLKAGHWQKTKQTFCKWSFDYFNFLLFGVAWIEVKCAAIVERWWDFLQSQLNFRRMLSQWGTGTPFHEVFIRANVQVSIIHANIESRLRLLRPGALENCSLSRSYNNPLLDEELMTGGKFLLWSYVHF